MQTALLDKPKNTIQLEGEAWDERGGDERNPFLMDDRNRITFEPNHVFVMIHDSFPFKIIVTRDL